jgi:hypothetical protein
MTFAGLYPVVLHVDGGHRRGEGRAHQGREPAAARRATQAVTSTFVVIDEVETENWGRGGLPVEQFREQPSRSSE